LNGLDEKTSENLFFLLLRIDKKIKNKHTPYLNITEVDGGGGRRFLRAD